jgi:hypothetical protein
MRPLYHELRNTAAVLAAAASIEQDTTIENLASVHAAVQSKTSELNYEPIRSRPSESDGMEATTRSWPTEANDVGLERTNDQTREYDRSYGLEP